MPPGLVRGPRGCPLICKEILEYTKIPLYRRTHLSNTYKDVSKYTRGPRSRRLDFAEVQLLILLHVYCCLYVCYF